MIRENFLGELKHALDLSKPKFVFVSSFAAKRVIEACKKLNYVKSVIVIDGKAVDKSAVALDDLIVKYKNVAFNVEERVAKKVDIGDQVALIFNSSGTTGLPKGVLITHKNIISVIQGMRMRISLYKMLHDRLAINMNVSPWFHALGFMSLVIVTCSRETTLVFLPRFEEELFLRTIEKYNVSTVTAVPPIMVMLAKSPLVDKYNLTQVTGEFKKDYSIQRFMKTPF